MKANRLLSVFFLVFLGNCSNGQSASSGATNAAVTATNTSSELGALNSGSSPDAAKGETIEELRAKAQKSGATAQFNRGCCYAKGKGMPTSFVEAVKWLRKAAEQNHAEAQFQLGTFSYYGQGVW